MKKILSVKILFVLTLLAGSLVLADSGGWWNKFFSFKKEPDVLKGNLTKAPLKPHQEAVNLQDSFAQVAEAVMPAVVNISAVHITRVKSNPQEFFFGDPNEFFHRFFGEPRQQRPREREFRSEGTGSGVIIDPEGYILTNNHVVQDADQLTVTLSDGKSLKGNVVGTDSRTDLAIIRIKSNNPFPFVPLGDSGLARIGDWVLAVGSPFGLEQTVTAGIISAIRQSLSIEGRVFSNLIQTDAAINRGNSGGPLVNLRGEVVGINTAIYAPTGVFSGIGFAIPVNEAKKILDDLIQKGFVERSWIGVEIAELDEVLAQQFGISEPGGALVNQVIPSSPAEKAGMKRGDVIVEVAGNKIDTVVHLQEVISSYPPKSDLKIKVVRDGKTKILNLKTELMPTQQSRNAESQEEEKTPKNDTYEWLGAEFSIINPQIQKQYDVDEAEGIIVLTVPPDSIAAEAGLMEGDLINAVNQQPVKTIDNLIAVTSKVNMKKGVVFDLNRRGRSFYLSYKSLQ